jgi:hypothetical protein
LLGAQLEALLLIALRLPLSAKAANRDYLSYFRPVAPDPLSIALSVQLPPPIFQDAVNRTLTFDRSDANFESLLRQREGSIPIVHEVAAGAGEYLECLAIRILWRSRLRFLKRNQVGLKSGAASAMLPRNSDEGQKQERRSC